MLVIEHSSSFLFQQRSAVFDGRGTVVHDCPTQCSGVQALILDFQYQSSLGVSENLFCQTGRMSGREGNLMSIERPEQFLLDFGSEDVSTVQWPVEYPGTLGTVEGFHVNGNRAVQHSDGDSIRICSTQKGGRLMCLFNPRELVSLEYVEV